MAYGIVHHWPGGTKEQYDTVLAALNLTNNSLPEGRLSMRPVNRPMVLPWLLFTTPRKVGSGSVTAP